MLSRIDLQTAAKALRKSIPGHVFVDAHARASGPTRAEDTDGWYASLGRLAADRELEIEVWLDAALNGTDRNFWIGIGSWTERAMRDLLRHAPPHMRPQFTAVSPQDYLKGTHYFLKRASRSTDWSVPVHEIDDGGQEQWYGIYFAPGRAFDLSRALGFLAEVVPELQRNWRPDELETKAIENDPNLDESERVVLRAARLGQGRYREQLEKIWRSKCAVTQIAQRELLRASHIKAWRACESTKERLDARNGLLLAAHLDALFDRYLISFENTGTIILSRRLSSEAIDLLGLSTQRIAASLHQSTQNFLRHHREALRRADGL
jgi:hypothetical protein